MIGKDVIGNKVDAHNNPQVWQQFAQQEQLSEACVQDFQFYAEQLIAWNQNINLTAITQIPAIITDHFQDSLALGHYIPLSANTALADIGSGAGFPAIPLAIRYRDVPITLLEVNNKKVQFLTMIINELKLNNCRVQSTDFRTFIRQAPIPVDYFMARASLAVPELLRILKPGSKYVDSQVVYWASRHWVHDEESEPYIVHRYPYTIDTKQRMLVVFAHTAAHRTT